MISKSTTKLIKSLAFKKIRLKENLFLVEGDKNVTEVLQSNFKIKMLFATEKFLSENQKQLQSINFIEVGKEEIKKSSLLKNPQNALAICQIPPSKPDSTIAEYNLSLYLDCIQDPGNFGTIIRICDWFGIENLFCSPDSVDFFNPKTIQATMGSFCRIKVWYTNLNELLIKGKSVKPFVYGTFLDGENLFYTEPEKKSLIVIGNEGSGIRMENEPYINKKISIPAYSGQAVRAESLNVGVATGIICAHFKQKGYSK